MWQSLRVTKNKWDKIFILSEQEESRTFHVLQQLRGMTFILLQSQDRWWDSLNNWWLTADCPTLNSITSLITTFQSLSSTIDPTFEDITVRLCFTTLLHYGGYFVLWFFKGLDEWSLNIFCWWQCPEGLVTVTGLEWSGGDQAGTLSSPLLSVLVSPLRMRTHIQPASTVTRTDNWIEHKKMLLSRDHYSNTLFYTH